MNALKRIAVILPLLSLVACVTINVYFPAAAAESAADTIIQGIYGEDRDNSVPAPAAGDDDQASLTFPGVSLVAMVLNAVIPAAQAQQPDINISTPGIDRLRKLMEDRHSMLESYYNSGAIGLDNDGLIVLRDENVVQLRFRNIIKNQVNAENNDRNALYAEVANANGHPEWEPEIRKTFARRWIANAPAGWWYMTPRGQWTQK